MVLINWTQRSEFDLRNIHDFIAADSKRFAKLQVVRIIDSTKHLERNIYLGRVVPEIGNTKIRELILGHYRIVYRIASLEQLDILTVHHSSRNLGNRIEEVKKIT